MAVFPLIVFDVNETLLDLGTMEPQAALIKRVGNEVLGVGPQPQIVGNDLNDVADQLIARHKRAA
jgi:hypothetical protein